MRRKVLILFATVATVLVTPGFAKWFEAKDRADQIVDRDAICSQARRTVEQRLTLYLICHTEPPRVSRRLFGLSHAAIAA